MTKQQTIEIDAAHLTIAIDKMREAVAAARLSYEYGEATSYTYSAMETCLTAADALDRVRRFSKPSDGGDL